MSDDDYEGDVGLEVHRLRIEVQDIAAEITHYGVTLRERAALMALAGLLISHGTYAGVAHDAVEEADALIAALNATPAKE